MHKCITFIFLLLCLVSRSQTVGCIDSIENYHFSTPNLRTDIDPSYITDNLNNAIIQVDTINSSSSIPNIGFIKLNAGNQFVFRKSYSQQNLSEKNSYQLSFSDNQNNLVFSGGSYTNSIERKGVLSNINAQGNMQWQKSYQELINTDKDNSIKQAISGANDDIIALTYQFNFPNSYYRIFRTDSNGNIQWSKVFYDASSTNVPIQNALIAFTGTEILLAGQYLYDNGKNGLFVCKLNYLNGDINATKSYRFFNNENSSPYIHTLNQFQFDLSRNTSTLVMWTDERVYEGFTSIVFDNSLDIVNSKNFYLNVANPHTNTGLDKFNLITYSYPQFADTSILYCVINPELKVISQKKVKLNPFPPFFNLAYSGKIVSRNNGIMSLMVNSFGAPNGDNMVFIDGSQSYSITNECLGFDTSFIIARNVDILSLNPIALSDVDMQLVATDLPLLVEENKNVEVIKICKEVSICDTLKMIGPSTKCLPDSFAHFSVYKNPLCRRKTIWHVDSSYILPVSCSDTSIDVKFLSSYRGFIFVSLDGCDLKDSLQIEIYGKKQRVDLGPDKKLCPDKPTIIYAGEGYLNYEWQDGSHLNFVEANSIGNFSVIVTDSCGNITKDTIRIDMAHDSLNLTYASPLCNSDTAIITIPSTYSNITWQPFEYGFYSNHLLKLFPASTTNFTISAEALSGCAVSDTILIKTLKCPNYIYFPTAFTPNNDGLNDLFKPAFSGVLEKYSLDIYNRWGQLIFKSQDPRIGWNGTFKSSISETCTYVFRCNYKFANEREEFKKGFFILLR